MTFLAYLLSYVASCKFSFWHFSVDCEKGAINPPSEHKKAGGCLKAGTSGAHLPGSCRCLLEAVWYLQILCRHMAMTAAIAGLTPGPKSMGMFV